MAKAKTDKGKAAKGSEDKGAKDGKVKGAQNVNVRHILVGSSATVSVPEN